MKMRAPTARGMALPDTLAAVPDEVHRCLMDEKAALAELMQLIQRNVAEVNVAQVRIRRLQGVADILDTYNVTGTARAKRPGKAKPAAGKKTKSGGKAAVRAKAKTKKASKGRKK